MTVSEMVETMQENDLFDIFPEFSKVVHFIAAISITSRCSAERSFSALRRMKTYLRSTMGQQRVSNIALINIEKPYESTMTWVVSLISSAVEMEEKAISFTF